MAMMPYILQSGDMYYCRICQNAVNDKTRPVHMRREAYRSAISPMIIMPAWERVGCYLCHSCTEKAYAVPPKDEDEQPLVYACTICPQEYWSKLHWIFPGDKPQKIVPVLYRPLSVARRYDLMSEGTLVSYMCIETATKKFEDDKCPFDKDYYRQIIRLFTQVIFSFFFFLFRFFSHDFFLF